MRGFMVKPVNMAKVRPKSRMGKRLNIPVLLFITALPYTLTPIPYACAGTEAAPFLKIDAGARAAALGGAFSAIADDASSVFHNPAGPGFMANDDLMLSHNEWIAGLKNEHFAYVHPQSERLTFFTGLNLLISPSLDKYDASGVKTGSFFAGEGALSVGAAWAFTDSFCGGLAAKGVYQQADKEKAYAYAGDLGFVKKYENLKLGLAVRNLGTRLKLYKESFALPLTFRGGAAYRLNDMFWFAADAFQTGSGLIFAGGAEGELPVTPAETVYARAGYKTGRSRNAGSGISAGVGLKSGELRFDYAFAPFGDLGDSHRLTVSFKFGEDREYLSREKKLRRVYRKAEQFKAAEKEKQEKTDQPAPDKNKKKAPPKKEVYFMW